MEAPATTQTQGDTYLDNLKRMDAVVRHMKEVAELPSEAPKDVSALQQVEFPETGGILTYMEGHEYPYKGFPYFEFVERIDIMKKVARSVLSGLYHETKQRPKILFLTLLPVMWAVRPMVRSGIYMFYRIIDRFKMRTICYCDAVRELHRALSLSYEGETVENQELREHFRDALCMLLEFDNAYRYRFQDLIEELDQKRIQTHTTQELVRILEIAKGREKEAQVHDTWRLFQMFLRFYLWADKPLKNILAHALANIDVSKVALTDADKHYCKPRKDYTFGFMQHDS